MVVGLLRAHIHIPYAQSLKDKRSVLKRLTHRLRSTYNCAVGEVDDHDLWQSAVLAIATVYRSREQVDSLFQAVERELAQGEDFQLLDHQIEYL